MQSFDRLQPITHLVVIAKECLPGRVKTPLTPAFTPEQAAEIASASLRQTLDTVRAVDVADRILLLDGRPDGLDLDGFRVVPQVAGGLDERIAAVFDRQRGGTLLIGMDTPQVSTALLQGIVDDVDADSWFGPAADGGFWALGMREPRGALVRGVPMSTPHTGRAQLARLEDAGLRPARLPVLRDVDTAADAELVARLMPRSRFAGTLAAQQAVARPRRAARQRSRVTVGSPA